MGAAFQAGGISPGLGEHGVRGLGVHRQAGMGGAGQGQLGVTEPEVIGRTFHEQGQGLERLDGRARVGQGVRITAAQHEAALRVGDREAAVVSGLDVRATQDFGQDHLGWVARRGQARQG